jgi:hypothetical protein
VSVCVCVCVCSVCSVCSVCGMRGFMYILYSLTHSLTAGGSEAHPLGHGEFPLHCEQETTPALATAVLPRA